VTGLGTLTRIPLLGFAQSCLMGNIFIERGAAMPDEKFPWGHSQGS
jgi:hypothetical protein